VRNYGYEARKECGLRWGKKKTEKREESRVREQVLLKILGGASDEGGNYEVTKAKTENARAVRRRRNGKARNITFRGNGQEVKCKR